MTYGDICWWLPISLGAWHLNYSIIYTISSLNREIIGFVIHGLLVWSSCESKLYLSHIFVTYICHKCLSQMWQILTHTALTYICTVNLKNFCYWHDTKLIFLAIVTLTWLILNPNHKAGFKEAIHQVLIMVGRLKLK